MILSLPALVPLLRTGFFESHDGQFHLYRLAALGRAVRSGVVYPRWFPEFAFGYGQPVLNFYGPLSYYWGLPFVLLGADAVLAMKLVFATGLVAAALGMYLFAHLHLDRGPALVAAVIYAYLPYHLVDLYVRGAVAEFLAFILMPLVLWAFHRLVGEPSRKALYRLALASLLLAALVVTHSLSAFLFTPFLAAYVTVLLVRQRKWDFVPRPAGAEQRAGHPAVRVVLALILALILSAFYWLPVLAESQHVGLGHGASQGYRDHLLPLIDLVSLSPAYPYPSQPGVVPIFPLGLVQVAIIVAACVLPFRFHRRRWVILLFLALALFSAFMLTTISLTVWRAFEGGLAFLQYPWRFQFLTVLATAFLAGALVQGLTRPSSPGRAVLGAVLLLATGFWALWRLPYAPSAPDLSVEAMWQMDREFGQVGTTWTGEYLPIWVKEQRWAISHPAPEPRPVLGALPAGQVELTGVGYTRYLFEADAPREVPLVLHQFYYPGWQAVEQGRGSYDAHPQGDLGLAAFDLPPPSGPFTVRLQTTPAQLWGTLISLVVSLATGLALVARYRRSATKPADGRLLVAFCYLLLAAFLLASLVWPNGAVRATHPVNANLEDSVELLAFTTDQISYWPGDTIQVTLYWRALHDLDQDFKAFVHLTDADLTRQPAQHDGDPGGGFTPTTRWLPGELIPDTHYLVLPADLMPGRYLLWSGMYEYETVRNLTVLSADVPTSEIDGHSARILLGEIEVAP